MKVSGTVKDAATGVPLPGAKISLYVIEKLVAVLQSDSEGKFEHKSEAQYREEILKCKVEKEGYEPREVLKDYKDELTLEIKLVPKKEEEIELTVNLKDEKRTPLKGVKVSLELDGEGVGVGISDKDGIFKISLSPDFEGKTINYKAELGGFELATGEVQLKKETSHEITMKKPPTPPPNKKWLKIAAGAAGIAAVILVAIFISQIIHPDMPVINSFEARPSAISAGEGSTLNWSVSDATSVTIDPEIGSVALTGRRQVSPTETTIYTLTATNDAGKRFDTVKVVVKEEIVNLPVINSFKASPSEIKPDESATLSWDVSDATSVTIYPGIGKVALRGTKEVSPAETTTYTLIATNDAGSVDDTVKVFVDKILLPDLYVSEFSLDPYTPIQGRPVSVSVGVYNKGTDRSGAFTVQWWAGENFKEPACTWRVDSLAARGGRILTCTYDGYRSWYGSLTTKVVVDSAEEVAESNEENNEYRKTISVSRSMVAVVTLKPTQMVLKPIQKTYSTGPLTISQTWTADLDEGKVGAGADSDIWFEAETATERYITPRNGATIAKVGTTSVGLEGCMEARLSSSRININDLPEGTYVCVRTNLGRYSQFRVNEPVGPSPGTLNIGYTTWEAI